MKITFLPLALLSCLASSVALAGFANIPATVNTGSNKSQAYVGLNWQVGGGMTPALVLGVADTNVKSNGDTTGINLAFHVNLAGGAAPGKLKLSALNGKNDLQGELGIGYNFLTAKPLLFLGLNAPYVALGVDGYLTSGFVPYATVQSLSRFDKPAYGCAAGYRFNGTDCTFVGP